MRIQRTLAAALSGALLATGVAALANPAVADVDTYDRGCDYFENGNGSAADPYQITDGDDLEAITWAQCYDEFSNYIGRAFEVDAYFIQVADIDLAEWDNWSPIGGVYNPWEDEYQDINGNYNEGGSFDGQYDGQNFAINNVKIEDNGFEHRMSYGIFGRTDEAVIENLSIDVYTDVASEFGNDISLDYFFEEGDFDPYYHHNWQNNNGFTGWIDWDDSYQGSYDETYDQYYWDYEVDTCWYGSEVGSLIGQAEDTVVRNVTADVEIRGGYQVGGLIGQINANDQGTQVINVDVTGTVDADALCGFAEIGGLVGTAEDDSQVINSDVAVDVATDFDNGDVVNRYEINTNDYNYNQFDDLDGLHNGAVVGWSEYSLFINTHSTGSLSVNDSEDVGGFLGWGEGVSIVDSSASGDVVALGSSVDVGGLVGELETDNGTGKSIIQNSFATGDVTSVNGDYVGGLMGAAEDNDDSEDTFVIVVDSYATGNVTGDERVGGLLGGVEVHSVVNSYATGNVIGDDEYVGGLIGYLDDYGTVVSSYATGDVTGTYNAVGGLIGYYSGRGTISKSYATGDVSVEADYSNEEVHAYGGLIGAVDDDVLIDKSYSTGTVDVSDAYVMASYDLGGLIGHVDYDVTIRSSYSTSDVIAHDGGPMGSGYSVGGFIGRVGDDSESIDIYVKNSYSLGDVTGWDNVAGFIGYIDGFPESVELVNNYTASKVDAHHYDMFANTYAGGDSYMFPWVITNMFVSEIKVGSDAGAVAVKAADIKKAATLKAAGWNISDTGRWSTKTWSTCTKVNEGLPYLSWQTSADLCICEGVVIPAVKFTNGSSKLSADSVAAITAAAQTIKDGKCKNVTLIGFTNTVKSNKAAKTLADARATAVRTVLKAALWEVGHPVKFVQGRDTLNTTQTRWNKVTITAAE